MGKELNEFMNNTESFIDNEMLMYETKLETAIENEAVKVIYRYAVEGNEEKIRYWLKKCAMLDKIEESELVEIAVKKKIGQLKEKNEMLELEVSHLKLLNKTYLEAGSKYSCTLCSKLEERDMEIAMLKNKLKEITKGKS